MHMNEILPKISENSLDHSKEGGNNVGHGGTASASGKGPGRIMNLKMFKKKKEQEKRRDKLSRNVASLTIGSKSGKESASGGNMTIDSSLHVVIPKRFTNSLGRTIEDETKHESSIETQKIHYLQNLTQIDLRKALRGINKNKNKKGYEYPPMVI